MTGTATHTPLATPPNALTAALHPTHVHPLASGVYAAGEYMANVKIELAPLNRPGSAVASGPRESYTRRVYEAWANGTALGDWAYLLSNARQFFPQPPTDLSATTATLLGRCHGAGRKKAQCAAEKNSRPRVPGEGSLRAGDDPDRVRVAVGRAPRLEREGRWSHAVRKGSSISDHLRCPLGGGRGLTRARCNSSRT